VGALDQADEAFQETALLAERAGTSHLLAWTRHFRASIVLSRGGIDEALQAQAPIRVYDDVVLSALADGEIARAHLLAGRLSHAEREATAVLDRERPMPTTHPGALCVLAEVQLRSGQAALAKHTAKRGLDLTSVGALGLTQELRLFALLADAHAALGEATEAAHAMAAARAKYGAAIASFDDPALARSFGSAHLRLALVEGPA
jgi:hypothetical protein